MKIGASNFYGFLAKSPVETCNELHKSGIDVIELMYEYPHLIPEKDAQKLGKLGLDYSMHCPFTQKCFVHPDPEFRRFQAGMVERSLIVAEKIGADVYVIHGGVIPDFYMAVENHLRMEDFRKIFVEQFIKMFQRASDSGIKVVFENLGDKDQFGASYEDIAWVQEKMPFIGFCLDIPHAFMFGGAKELNRYIDKLNVNHVHVSDSVARHDRHFPVGKGHIPIRETLQMLKNKGYSGKVIFEGFSLKDTLESVKKLREIVK